MPQFVYFLDLVDDPALIAEYDAWHQRVFPEVLEHLKSLGFASCQIYRTGNRLAMVVESEEAAASDGGGATVPERVKEWEELMDRFQSRLPWANEGEKWVRGNLVFDWRR